MNGVLKLHQLYRLAGPTCTSRVTVPVLWDKKRTIVSNESADILWMFNSAFDDLGAKRGNYYSRELRAEIDEVNSHLREFEQPCLRGWLCSISRLPTTRRSTESLTHSGG